MNNEEIKSRIDSDIWSQQIANKVSVKYQRNQTKNRLILSTSAVLLIVLITTVSYFIPNDFLNTNLAELDTYRLFLSDDFTPLYDSMYQEERISSLLEPISFLIK